MLEQLRDADAALPGRTVLIVDDDVRNVFALTSALEAHGMEVVFAENGREALDAAAGQPRRRPRPDGHDDAGDGRLRDDARRSARCREFERLPIIALTAKAMKGDREKSIAAGRVGLHHQAGRRRPARLADARVAVPLTDARGRRASSSASSSSCCWRRSTGATATTSAATRAASLRRRLWRRARPRGPAHAVGAAGARPARPGGAWSGCSRDLSINVTEMFRDPAFHRALREQVVPAAAHAPVRPRLGRGLLDGRGGRLDRHRAARGGAARARAHLRDRHGRRRARARAARARSRSTSMQRLHAQLPRAPAAPRRSRAYYTVDGRPRACSTRRCCATSSSPSTTSPRTARSTSSTSSSAATC